MKRARIAVAVAAALMLGGCGGANAAGGHPLVAGRVDTATILQADPDYTSMSKQYFDEQVLLKQDYVKASAGKSGAEVDQLRDSFSQKQRDLVKKWSGKTKEFLETRHTRLQDAVAAICKDKGIDLVVIDSRLYPSVEYGATDITQEVVTKMYGSKAAAGSPTPGAAPAEASPAVGATP